MQSQDTRVSLSEEQMQALKALVSEIEPITMEQAAKMRYLAATFGREAALKMEELFMDGILESVGRDPGPSFLRLAAYHHLYGGYHGATN